MANVTVSPVVPFNNEDEQKSEYVHDDNIKKQPTSSSKSKTEGHDLFEAVQQATFKQVQISHQGGVDAIGRESNACKKPRKKCTFKSGCLVAPFVTSPFQPKI